jgi:hypothetical protein
MAVCGTCKREMIEAAARSNRSTWTARNIPESSTETILRISRWSQQPAVEIAAWKRAASIIRTLHRAVSVV